MMFCVKCVTLFFCLLAMGMQTGCTVVDQDGTTVGNQLQRGMQGQGRIVPNDPSDDSYGSDYN